MKKSITGTVALLAGAVIAHSQGTVSFANYMGGGNYVTVEYNFHIVGGTATHTGTPYADTAVGADWFVELYGVAGANQPLNSLILSVRDGTPGWPVAATLWEGGTGPHLGQWLSTEVGDISGTTSAGQVATVAVAAWYNNGGTVVTYQAAQAWGFPSGFSATANVITGGALPGGGSEPPAPLPQLGNGIINMGVPEPATMALCIMGVSAFLLRSRRKQ